MRKIYSLLFALALLGATKMNAQVTVTGCTGAGNATYATLAAATAAIVAAQPAAVISITISANITEPVGGATLVAGTWTSLSIKPSGGSFSITGATTAGTPLLTLNGSDNVTIDGLNSGGNALTISNTTASATSGTSTIKLIGGATNNTITNCSILGSGSMAVGTNGGNFWFSTDGTTANGNDNNTISNNLIGPAGSNLPSKGIYGNGSTTTTAIGNSGNTITNNNFADIFGAAVTSAGIYVVDGCNTWSITNNRFYQTGTRTWTTGALNAGININSATATQGAQAFTITGNIIGYASSTQTGTYTLTGSTGSFYGIRFNGITLGTASNINTNTIASVSLSGVTSSGTSTSNPFTGILVVNGVANTNGNIIGSQTVTGSLTFSTTTTSSADVYGIFNFSSDSWTSSSNSIGGISVTNAGASGTFLLYALRANTGTGVTWTAASNLIGGTVANSIQLNATGASSQLVGMFTSNAGATFTSNIIRNLSSNIGTGTTSSASVIGINLTSSTLNNSVSQNTIHSLSNTSAATATTVSGLQMTGSTANVVSKNFIHSLSVASATGAINGIIVGGGTTTYSNNMIRLGINAAGSDITVGAAINGINETVGTDNFYFNSIYIGGANVVSSVNTFAFNSAVTTSTRSFRNNIFYNARSNTSGTANNYAVQVGGTTANPTGLTINYNIYLANGTGGLFGRFNSANVANLTAWKTSVGQDVNSWESNPQFLTPAGTSATVDLHINPSVATAVEAKGVNISGITDDFDAQTRSTLTPEDIGADAGNFTALPLCTGTPATSTISGAASVCSGTGTSLSLSVNYTDIGITYQWSSGTTPGGPYGTTLGTAATQATGNLTASTYYRCVITCTNSVLSYTTVEKSVLINALPTVVVSPSSASFCSPGGAAVVLTASGASTYTWAPATGLSATTGSTVNASPASSQVYVATGTDGNGCIAASNNATVTVAPAVTMGSVTATPATICSGANSQLLASASLPVTAASSMVYSSGTGQALETLTSSAIVTTTTSGTIDDGYMTVSPASFTFNYLGTNYTSFTIGTNGYVVLGGTSTTVPSSITTISSNVIYAFGRDANLNTTNAGNLTHGPAAGGKYVFQMNKNSGAASGVESSTIYATYQFVLWGSTSAQPGRIDIIYGTSAGTVATAGTIGIRDAAGTFVNGVNGSTSLTTTAAVWPTSGQIYTFAKPAPSTYAWTPSTFIVGQEALANPLATAVSSTTTYNVTASQGGCSATGTVTVTVSAGAAITTDPSASAKCAGQTATFTVLASGPGLTYQWRKGGNNISIGGNASAGTATLSLPTVSATDIATYDVVVSSTCGSPVTSAGAALTVTTPLAGINTSATTICSGSSVTLTENGGTATSWSWVPGGQSTQAITVSPATTTTYTVTATVNTCSATANQIITVNPTPSAVTVTPSNATICLGGSVGLAATGGAISATSTLGTGTTSTTASSASSPLGPNPLQSYYGGSKQQMIVLASELTSLGLVNGSAISSVAFNLNVAETGRTLNNLQVKVSNTALSAFASTTFAAAGTVVRNAANFSVATGWNTITFNNNFIWNGTSNLLIEVNFSNADGGGTGTSTALYSTTAFASTLFYRVDDATAATVDAVITASFAAYTQRNNMQLGYINPASFVWTPATSGLDVYTGANVIASPLVTTAYTATSTVGGCSSFNTAAVTIGSANITASASAGGSISPAGLSTVNCGTNPVYTITPATCYSIADVLVDGVSQGAIGSYTFTNVTSGSHTISASFILNTYTITVTPGANGSVTPATGSINCGSNATYTITANSLYQISDVVVDAVSQGIITSYTFTNVTTTHTISASFILSCTNVSLASASATATPICSDATTTLTYTDLAGTGASVTWYDGTGGTGNTYGTGTPSSSVSPGTYYAYATGTCGTPVEIQVVVGSTPLTTITVAAAPTSQTVYINDPSPANLTVTATGASLTYQWFSNGSNSNAGGTSVGAGSGGQTNTYTPPTNVLGTKYYYVVVTGTCGTQTSSAVAVTITNTNTWKQGNATTNWSLASNWTGNAVPTGANDAAIPVGNTPYPALTAAASINNLIIDPTATVSLNGFTLTINGTVTGTGTLSGSATSNLITSSSTTLLFTSGSNTLKNLNVNSGTLTLGNALNITGGTAANTYGTVTVATGATLASGGNLTIQSNQFGTARVAAGDAAGNYITGDVTVERYIPANSKRSWRLLSVPTKGTKTIKQTWQENQAPLANGTPGFGTLITSNIATTAASQAAGFDAFSQLPSMQSYNSGTQGWVYVTSTNSAPIQTNKGYFLYIRGDRSVTTSSSTDAAGATVLRTTGTLYQGNSNPAVSIAAGKFEPVGNTFASAVDFSGLAKTGGISNTFYVWDSKLLSGTTLGAYQTFNGAIGFTPATPGGSYPSGVPNTSIESGEAIMLGAVGSAGTVALVESSKIAGNEFTPFRPSALPAQFKTSLLKVTGSTTVFADNNIVVFDRAYANVVDANDALKIQKAGETMSIVTDSKSLIVDARQPVAPGDVIRFNMGNLQPQAYKLSFTTQNMNTTGLTAFVEDKYLYSSTAINLDAVSDYTFTVDAANAASSAKDRFSVVFKKVGAAAIAVVQPVFVISPNPVEGGVVNVEFKNQVAGKYGIRLLDAGGAVIFSTFATHGGGTGSQRLSLPSGISRGSYQLEITAPGKSRELQTLFIHTSK